MGLCALSGGAAAVSATAVRREIAPGSLIRPPQTRSKLARPRAVKILLAVTDSKAQVRACQVLLKWTSVTPNIVMVGATIA